MTRICTNFPEKWGSKLVERIGLSASPVLRIRCAEVLVQREIGGYMVVIQGAVTDYQTATHVTGSMTRDVGGLVSSSHIATFQINGQTVQIESAAPAGLVNGDVLRVTGQRNSSGIFEVKYYFNVTRKCHSPPPKTGLSRFLCKTFMLAGIAIILGSVVVDWAIYTDDKGVNLWSLISSHAPAVLLAAFLFEGGRRSLNQIKAMERGYRNFIHQT